MSTLLQLNNVSKSYGSTPALSGVNLSLESGKLVGLLGPNASGKTTMIKVINGLLKNYSGEVVIDGGPVGPRSKAIISYLPDTTYLSDWMKVKDAITLFSDMYPDFDSGKMDTMLHNMEIDKNQKIKAMSKGTKEKMQLALVMSRDAKIYIFDEPIGGVDPAAREYILEVIRHYRSQDSLVIISTHLITDIEEIFDQVIFLKKGQVVLFDDAQAIRDKEGKSINDLFKEVFRHVV
ncbi:MAG: ABC transporter ATP-binding protein [Erysipelotrichaceae bacterium]|jgi:ABC-2 type transport system ATP-binding protein|nr:ABC transporter ATP-binding protein [Erysipelotrichaceae bacterium]